VREILSRKTLLGSWRRQVADGKRWYVRYRDEQRNELEFGPFFTYEKAKEWMEATFWVDDETWIIEK
jgi:hypothetical protein